MQTIGFSVGHSLYNREEIPWEMGEGKDTEKEHMYGHCPC